MGGSSPGDVQQPSGIRGWLLLFVVGQIGLVIYGVSQVPSRVRSTFAAWPSGQQLSMLRPVLTLGLFGLIMSIVLPFLGLALIQTKSADAPRFWRAFLSFYALYAAAAFVLNVLLANQVTNVLGPAAGHDFSKSIDRSNGAYIRSVIGTFIWASYWSKSVRVRNTFPSVVFTAE